MTCFLCSFDSVLVSQSVLLLAAPESSTHAAFVAAEPCPACACHQPHTAHEDEVLVE